MAGGLAARDGADEGLSARIVEALAEVGVDLEAGGYTSLTDALGEALSVVEGDIDAQANGELAQRCQTLVRLFELREELTESHAQRRLRTYARVQQALGRLRSATSVDAIVAEAPRAVCEAGNFDRSVIYGVSGSDMLAEAVYVRGDPDAARAFLAYSREHPAPLDERIMESELARRRVPLLIRDALNNPNTYKPLVGHYQTNCYVAAPIMPEGRVIGFLHADRELQRPKDPDGVDEFDRDVLWAFAEGLGYAIERAHLAEKLRSQADEVAALLTQTRSVVTEYLESRVEMISAPAEATAATRTAEAMFAGPESKADRTLSRRELEVLALVSDGATNAQIAARLFITESTAKAHVGRILRKLGAGNRVEAARIYHRARNE
ncbi:LuxR C-terminal-related transcriptional regulator [Mycobacterium sp. NBC_00419]|uniref:LuxR C-terminal-related transcriptional regulator n=1 Tax=Mycobacterium sp. NBC_00419 TaxID=2975989 RepID=UPI002E1DFC87